MLVAKAEDAWCMVDLSQEAGRHMALLYRREGRGWVGYLGGPADIEPSGLRRDLGLEATSRAELIRKATALLRTMPGV